MNKNRVQFLILSFMALVVPAYAVDIQNISPETDLTTLLYQEENYLIDTFESGRLDSRNLTEITPHLDYICRNLALGLSARGEYEKASEVLELVPSESLSRESAILRIFILCRLSDYDSAIEHLNELRVRYPDDVTLDNAMAYILGISGYPNEAMRIQKRVMKLAGDHAPSQDTWGVILTSEGDLKQAEWYLKKAYDSLPDDAEVQIHLARVYSELGRKNDAQDLYQQAVSTDPFFGPGQKEYARILMDLGRYQETAGVIRKAIRLMPEDPDLIEWEQEIDSILLSWYVRQEEEAKRPHLTR